jgi:hypothetical protein
MAEQVQLGFGSILGRQKALNHLQSSKSDLRDERFGKPSASARERMIACPGSVQQERNTAGLLAGKAALNGTLRHEGLEGIPRALKASARTRTFRGSYPLMIRESLRGQEFFLEISRQKFVRSTERSCTGSWTNQFFRRDGIY